MIEKHQLPRFFFVLFLLLFFGMRSYATNINDIRPKLVAEVSAVRIEQDIKKLVSFGTRHTLSDTVSNTRGIGAARRWIEDEFKRISDNCGG